MTYCFPAFDAAAFDDVGDAVLIHLFELLCALGVESCELGLQLAHLLCCQWVRPHFHWKIVDVGGDRHKQAGEGSLSYTFVLEKSPCVEQRT